MTDKIPFTLTNGVSGYLSRPSGAASSNLFHIMVGKTYKGQLYQGRTSQWATTYEWLTDGDLKPFVGELVSLVEH